MVVAVALVSALSGCSAPVEDEAASAAETFAAAAAEDPTAACALLAPGTIKELEADAEAVEIGLTACPEVLPTLGLPGAGEVRSVSVAGQMAQVVTSTQTLFLSRFNRGWLVVAAGCQPAEDPDLPLDCAVKGA